MERARELSKTRIGDSYKLGVLAGSGMHQISAAVCPPLSCLKWTMPNNVTSLDSAG